MNRKLLPDDFVALRSLALSDWQIENGGFLWKTNGEWFAVYRHSPEWVYCFWEMAFAAVERLEAMGLAESAIKTCCTHHYGEPIWRLTEKGKRFVDRANAVKQPKTVRAPRKRKHGLNRLLKSTYWRVRNMLADGRSQRV